MKRKRNISVFYKYLISFFLVALIPIGIGVVSFYQYNMNSLKKQTEIINRQKLRQSAGLLDDMIYHHFRMASAVVAEPALKLSQLVGDSYDRYESLTIIRPYLNRYTEWEKGFLIMKDADIVYSATGIMAFSTLCSMTLGFDAGQERILRENLDDAGGYTVLGPDVFQEYLTFIHPIPNHHSYADLVFFMDLQDIRRLLLEETENGEGRLLILQGEGEVIVSDFSEEETQRYASLQAAGEAAENGISFYRSDLTGLTYGVWLGEDDALLKELRQQKNVMLLVCFAILFLCMGLAFAVASFTYRPIRNLFLLLDKPMERRDEMAVLHEYMENQKLLAQSVHWQTPYVRQRIMELYLEGLIDGAELEKAFAEFHFGQEGNCYFAVVIGMDSGKGMITSHCRQQILNLSLETELRRDVHICHMEQIRETSVAWIVNIGREEKVKDLMAGIQGELDVLFAEERTGALLGVGSCVDRLGGIRSSYYEALAAREYLEGHPGGRMLSYGDLSAVLQQEELPDGEGLLKLVQALRKGDRELSQELFSQFYDGLRRNYRSQILFKYFSYKMLKLLKEAMCGHIPENMIEEFSAIASVEEEAQQEAQLRLFLQRVCDYSAVSRKSTQLGLTNRILDYIRENAFQPSLSLEQMGDEFGLSPYYISRFMTEQTGSNLKNYITKLRMEEAKRLLKETSMPLYEIVVHVGYLDVSSFIRKFKREMGKTPGEYREEFGNHGKQTGQ